MPLQPLTPSDESFRGARPTPLEELPKRTPPGASSIAPLSLALIVACVGVALYSNLGNNTAALMPLFITELSSPPASLWEVRHGEVWRLFTPAFIHFGPVHLIFNMLWLKDLGTLIERRHGAAFLFILAACLAVTSNVGQYYVSGPVFGGMSGVVYGLFGYVWLRGRTDPGSGFSMPGQTVLIMLLWFVLCVVGIIPHVANTAHGVGLVVGALWGLIAGQLRPARAGGIWRPPQ